MTLTPMHDRVVLKLINIEQETQSGIILTTHENRGGDTVYAKVVAAGPGKAYDGTGIIPTTVKAGDIVIFKPNTALKHEHNAETFHIIRESEIAAIVEGVVESDLPTYHAESFKSGPRELESLL